MRVSVDSSGKVRSRTGDEGVAEKLVLRVRQELREREEHSPLRSSKISNVFDERARATHGMRPRHDDSLQEGSDNLLARNFVRGFGESREEEGREPVGVRVGVPQLVCGGSDDEVATCVE